MRLYITFHVSTETLKKENENNVRTVSPSPLPPTVRHCVIYEQISSCLFVNYTVLFVWMLIQQHCLYYSDIWLYTQFLHQSVGKLVFCLLKALFKQQDWQFLNNLPQSTKKVLLLTLATQIAHLDVHESLLMLAVRSFRRSDLQLSLKRRLWEELLSPFLCLSQWLSSFTHTCID